MRTLAIVLLTLSLYLAGCATSDDADPTPDADDDAPDVGQTMTPVDVTVTVGDGPAGTPPKIYTISPAKLELALDTPVNLTLVNKGRGVHDLVIDGIEGAVIESTPAGQSKSIVFTPTEAGTFPMYCTIGGGSALSHKDHGMAGEAVVA